MQFFGGKISLTNFQRLLLVDIFVYFLPMRWSEMEAQATEMTRQRNEKRRK